jgi:hypothetical protein
MSNLNIEKQYDNFNDWLEFAIQQINKNMFVAVPAIINSYDASTRRAVAQIALKQVFTDGTEQSYPLVSDVPILFPASSKFVIQMPLDKGDAVMLLFSQRGIGTFKQTLKEESPSKESFFSMHDAVAIVGFGALSITPAVSDALTMQNNDGTSYLSLTDDEIKIETTTKITLTSPDIEVNGNMTVNGGISATGDFSYTGVGSGTITYPNITASDTLTINGQNFTMHQHSGVTTGGDDTGGVVP